MTIRIILLMNAGVPFRRALHDRGEYAPNALSSMCVTMSTFLGKCRTLRRQLRNLHQAGQAMSHKPEATLQDFPRAKKFHESDLLTSLSMGVGYGQSLNRG